jgi:hypothetical protein
MSRAILRKAWRDVRRVALIVPAFIAVIGIICSGLTGSGDMSPGYSLVGMISWGLAFSLGGEEAMAGTRDLLRTRALDLKLHVTLRFALGLAVLGASFLLYAAAEALGLDRLISSAFGIHVRVELDEFSPGMMLRRATALMLAYALGFAAARASRKATSAQLAAAAAVWPVVLLSGFLELWGLYLARGSDVDKAVSRAVMATVEGVMLLLAAACFAHIRRKALVRP